MRNLVAAASDLALGESVLYGHRRHRSRYSRPVYYGYREPYGYPTTYFGYGVGYDYGPVPFGYRLVPGLYFRR